MVLSVCPVTAGVERQVGDGGVGIGEMEIADGRYKVTERMNENKLVFQFRSFDKNTIQARRSKISERVIFPS